MTLVGRVSHAVSPSRLALAIAVLATATVAGAWTFEALGYQPCELCLKQRLSYYVGIPLAVILALPVLQAWPRLSRLGFALLALLFVAGAGAGIYHAGVEYHFWPGPSDCTGPLTGAPSAEDFFAKLQSAKSIIRCDEVALRVFGLSLAVWNVLISFGLAAAAGLGFQLSRPSK
jgi:disulfide bond formation protein DsbB